jgi:hypothetical protein
MMVGKRGRVLVFMAQFWDLVLVVEEKSRCHGSWLFCAERHYPIREQF